MDQKNYTFIAAKDVRGKVMIESNIKFGNWILWSVIRSQLQGARSCGKRLAIEMFEETTITNRVPNSIWQAISCRDVTQQYVTDLTDRRAHTLTIKL